mmetsp:Transcript_11497/g.35866  ORF Transcript_11497/g.35866 Transcript_11497/m.35866 type:complete len:118 (+) Transcript_11497:284-637(+)
MPGQLRLCWAFMRAPHQKRSPLHFGAVQHSCTQTGACTTSARQRTQSFKYWFRRATFWLRLHQKSATSEWIQQHMRRLSIIPAVLLSLDLAMVEHRTVAYWPQWRRVTFLQSVATFK